MNIIEYAHSNGISVFSEWFETLEPHAAMKVATVVERMGQGLMGDVKPVGSGVSERRIDYGPGYRVYFAKDGDRLIILLGGGSKKRQQSDIQNAIYAWQDYKKRKEN